MMALELKRAPVHGPGRKTLYTWWKRVTQTRAYYDSSEPNTRQRLRAAQRAQAKVLRAEAKVKARRARVAKRRAS